MRTRPEAACRALILFVPLVLLACAASAARAAELLVGTATVDITPAGPVALDGQFNLRVSRKAETPITASVAVLQSHGAGKPGGGDGAGGGDVAVMVSCDLVQVPAEALDAVRRKVRERVPDLDVGKIFLSATHTHTAPVMEEKYPLPDGVMGAEAYRPFLAERVAGAIEQAWRGRKPGSVSWGLSHAVVAQNRRISYLDGTAKMYGPTGVPSFRGLEGYEDHDVNSLFLWDAGGRLICVAVNVSCPSQEVENGRSINADFWHPVREALRAKYGPDLCVLAWTGAAGDQSPHIQYRKGAEERMRKLRGLSRVQEIARRIVVAVDDAYETVKNDRHADVPLVHRVETARLPMRLVAEAEHQEARKAHDAAARAIERNPKAADAEYRRMKWYEVTLQRWERQQAEPRPTHDVELHVVRIGDVAIVTNPFELFTEYGIRMKARSRAGQTFVVQLTGGGSYLPTEEAVRGGSYSAIVHSGLVGPEGGQVLVDRTVEAINAMWAAPSPGEEKLIPVPPR